MKKQHYIISGIVLALVGAAIAAYYLWPRKLVRAAAPAPTAYGGGGAGGTTTPSNPPTSTPTAPAPVKVQQLSIGAAPTTGVGKYVTPRPRSLATPNEDGLSELADPTTGFALNG